MLGSCLPEAICSWYTEPRKWEAQRSDSTSVVLDFLIACYLYLNDTNKTQMSGKTASAFEKLTTQTAGTEDESSKQLDKRELNGNSQGFLLSWQQGDAAGAPWMAPCEVGWRKRHKLVFTISLHFISDCKLWSHADETFFSSCLATPIKGKKKNVPLVAVCYFNGSYFQLRVIQCHIFSVFQKKVRGGLHIIAVYFSIFILMGTWRFHTLLDQN